MDTSCFLITGMLIKTDCPGIFGEYIQTDPLGAKLYRCLFNTGQHIPPDSLTLEPGIDAETVKDIIWRVWLCPFPRLIFCFTVLIQNTNCCKFSFYDAKEELIFLNVLPQKIFVRIIFVPLKIPLLLQGLCNRSDQCADFRQIFHSSKTILDVHLFFLRFELM